MALKTNKLVSGTEIMIRVSHLPGGENDLGGLDGLQEVVTMTAMGKCAWGKVLHVDGDQMTCEVAANRQVIVPTRAASMLWADGKARFDDRQQRRGKRSEIHAALRQIEKDVAPGLLLGLFNMEATVRIDKLYDLVVAKKREPMVFDLSDGVWYLQGKSAKYADIVGLRSDGRVVVRSHHKNDGLTEFTIGVEQLLGSSQDEQRWQVLRDALDAVGVKTRRLYQPGVATMNAKLLLDTLIKFAADDRPVETADLGTLLT